MSTPRNTGRTPLRASRIARVVTALGFAVMVGSTATMTACSDTPSAPNALENAAPAYNKHDTPEVGTVLTPPLRVKALLREVPLREAQTRSFDVKGAHGGVIEWPELGLKVVVPQKGFKGQDMTITITALAGDVIAYDFGPDGSRFDQPLTVVQSLKGTNYAKLRGKALLRGAYFKHASQVSDATNSAVVNEFQLTDLDVKGWNVRFQVTHFSGYMVSTD